MLKRKLFKSAVIGQCCLFFLYALSVYSQSATTYAEVALLNKTAIDTTGLIPTPEFGNHKSPQQSINEAPKIKMHSSVETFVARYIKTNNEALWRIKKRSHTYFEIIEPILKRQGLPVELKYLAVVESDLKTSALSPAGAAGPWQLMPQTARMLGLKITSRYDERKQIYKSTKAVAQYLKDLYGQFDDWLLVIAAYNAGPGNVYKAIKKSGSRNFWALQRYLPAETRGHVKRFISTHYYFEEAGGETTQTKAERLAYQKEILAYQLSQANTATEVEADTSINESAAFTE